MRATIFNAKAQRKLIMFFILSKVLFFLLAPISWLVILYLWMRLSKSPKSKKRLLAAIILIALVFTNPFIYRTMVGLWQPGPVEIPASTTYEAGVVLGGMAGYDKFNRGYFGDNADRFIQTANLYHQGIIKKIIISGGTGSLQQDEQPEAFFLRREFIANNVQDADIIIDQRSRNTFENAVYSKQLIDSLQLKPPFVLVTSALHMRRSVSVFKKTGYAFIPFPCDYKTTPSDFSLGDFIPSLRILNNWTFFLKEVVGLYVYKLTGKA